MHACVCVCEVWELSAIERARTSDRECESLSDHELRWAASAAACCCCRYCTFCVWEWERENSRGCVCIFIIFAQQKAKWTTKAQKERNEAQ